MLLAPDDVARVVGARDRRVTARAIVMATAYTAHPERCSRGLPQPCEASWGEPGSIPATARRARRDIVAAVPPACSRGSVRLACRRSLACGRQGEADGSPCKAREGEGESQATACP